MDRVTNLINQKNYLDLFKCCQQLELQSVTDVNINMKEIYPIYMASCILNNDFQGARYIRKRIQSQAQSSAEIEAIWSVAVAHIEKSYSDIYSRIGNYQWTELMQELIVTIKESARDQMLRLIPNVYSSIQLDQACDFFGMAERELLAELTNIGWSYDAETKILYPMKSATLTSNLTNEKQFSNLADIVIQLEKV